MKKNWIFVVLATLTVAFFASAQVMAAGPVVNNSAHSPSHTPGVPPTSVATPGVALGKSSSNPHGKPANYRGSINTVDASSLVLTLRDGSSVTFVLDTGTVVKIPTMRGSGSVADLKSGMEVGVHAVDGSGTLTAKMVLVVPGKPVLMHRVGVVTAYTAGASITIQATDGNTYTYLITSATRLLPSSLASQLAVGSYVTIIMPRDVTGGAATASGIVIHPTP